MSGQQLGPSPRGAGAGQAHTACGADQLLPLNSCVGPEGEDPGQELTWGLQVPFLVSGVGPEGEGRGQLTWGLQVLLVSGVLLAQSPEAS